MEWSSRSCASRASSTAGTTLYGTNFRKVADENGALRSRPKKLRPFFRNNDHFSEKNGHMFSEQDSSAPYIIGNRSEI